LPAYGLSGYELLSETNRKRRAFFVLAHYLNRTFHDREETFRDGKPQSGALCLSVRLGIYLAIVPEQFRDVLFFDTDARVFDIRDKPDSVSFSLI